MVDLDERLRSYGTRWRDTQPAPDVELPAAPASARHVAAIATVAVVVAALFGAVLWSQRDGHDHVTPAAGTGGVVPWVDDRAKATSPPTTAAPVNVRPCVAGDITVGTPDAGGAAGSMVWSVPLSKHGTDACSIPLTPGVTAVGQDGRRVTLGEAGDSTGPSPTVVRAGTSVRLLLQAPNGCPPGSSAVPNQSYHDVELLLQAGTLPVPGLEPVLCDAHLFGKTIEGDPPPPPEPGTVASLNASIDPVAISVQHGSELDYTVVLKNTTGTAVDLRTSCPVYTETINMAATGETLSYRLNCAAAPLIVGYGEVRFAMVAPAPGVTGTGKLSWQLTPDGPSAGAPLSIE